MGTKKRRGMEGKGRKGVEGDTIGISYWTSTTCVHAECNN